jgi:hypothetical protein
VGLTVDLDAKLGPLTGRAWGLILNFAFNALALYGVSTAVRGGGGETLLGLGVAGTVGCLLVLARPSR